ncbi:hypothetical protein THER5_1137 [Bifidobacterium thermacidophilum subsp. thermacidophilum]|uniref:Uncharacterized protein n=1 Tax=Bifidobacterium thermacidophilum subsp. thermacidophilum TaxID=79262 RepID=A0A087E4H3_9BIFI|nr:hypothetical protein THER5_1137 [Bifidobacterium thermacidophilum subsp. thermacidophilum]
MTTDSAAHASAPDAANRARPYSIPLSLLTMLTPGGSFISGQMASA